MSRPQVPILFAIVQPSLATLFDVEEIIVGIGFEGVFDCREQVLRSLAACRYSRTAAWGRAGWDSS